MGQRRPLWMSESQNRGWNGSNGGTNILTDRDKEANDTIHPGPCVVGRVSFKRACSWMDIWYICFTTTTEFEQGATPTSRNYRGFTTSGTEHLLIPTLGCTECSCCILSQQSAWSHIFEVGFLNRAYLLQFFRCAILYCLQKWSR